MTTVSVASFQKLLGCSVHPHLHLIYWGRIRIFEPVIQAMHKQLGGTTKLDQGALGMSDPLGPLQLALKPNSASSINRPLLNFYYCAH